MPKNTLNLNVNDNATMWHIPCFQGIQEKPSLSYALWFMYVKIHDNICLMLYFRWSFTHKWWAFPKWKAKLNYVLSCLDPLVCKCTYVLTLGLSLPCTYGIGERLSKSHQLWVAIIQVIYACMYVYTYICIFVKSIYMPDLCIPKPSLLS